MAEPGTARQPRRQKEIPFDPHQSFIDAALERRPARIRPVRGKRSQPTLNPARRLNELRGGFQGFVDRQPVRVRALFQVVFDALQVIFNLSTVSLVVIGK